MLLLFSVILIVVISIYMLLDMERLERAIDARFPPYGGTPLAQRIEGALWGYLKGQAILSTVIGASAGVGMYVLGVTGLVDGAQHYALLFALWTAFVEVIPYIGPWLSAVPPAIYAIFVDAPWGVVWVGLLFLVIYQVEGHIVVPNVMANALRLHPLLVIFGLLAGGELYGIAGVLVALPTMAGGRAIWEFFRERIALESWEQHGDGPRRTRSSSSRRRSRATRTDRGATLRRVCWRRSPPAAAGRAHSGRRACAPRGRASSSPCSPRSPRPSTRLGLETIYEGYLVHYGRPRLFAPPDEDTALLLGDYLYAHGLVRVAESGDVEAVADLAELISLCAQARARGHERRRRRVGGDGLLARARRARRGAGRDAGPGRHEASRRDRTRRRR